MQKGLRRRLRKKNIIVLQIFVLKPLLKPGGIRVNKVVGAEGVLAD